MSYYVSKVLTAPFDSAVTQAKEALKREGLGIITEIDIKATLKSKLGVDFRDYRILGACNPEMAHKALQLEDKVGTMLPCNVVVHDIGGGKVEVAAIDPVASMQAIDNPDLRRHAGVVQERLRHAISSL